MRTKFETASDFASNFGCFQVADHENWFCRFSPNPSGLLKNKLHHVWLITNTYLWTRYERNLIFDRGRRLLDSYRHSLLLSVVVWTGENDSNKLRVGTYLFGNGEKGSFFGKTKVEENCHRSDRPLIEYEGTRLRFLLLGYQPVELVTLHSHLAKIVTNNVGSRSNSR